MNGLLDAIGQVEAVRYGPAQIEPTQFLACRPVHRDSCAQLPALNTLLYLDSYGSAQAAYTKASNRLSGVILSPVAVRDFFAENSMRPQRQRNGKFTLWQSGHISILCGDFFALRACDLGAVDTVYDRAALTALPADIRKLYCAHLTTIVAPDSTILLLTIEDAEVGATLEQALGVDSEIAQLYAADYAIALAHVESIIEPNPDLPGESRRADYKVYRISGRSDFGRA